jgi:hypothetical protein
VNRGPARRGRRLRRRAQPGGRRVRAHPRPAHPRRARPPAARARRRDARGPRGERGCRRRRWRYNPAREDAATLLPRTVREPLRPAAVPEHEQHDEAVKAILI